MPLDSVAVDVVIAGAGPAGAALAIRLARAGLLVVLVEARPRNPELWVDRPGERLPPKARFMLDALGVAWERIAAPQIEAWSLWAGFDPEDISDPTAPALLVSRRDLDAVLIDQATAVGAQLLDGFTVRAIAGEPGDWRMDVRRNHDIVRLVAPFVVDATGRQSALCAALALAPARRADPLIALVRWWSHATKAARPYFLVEAIENGWWYAASVPGGRGVAGFLTMRPLLTDRPEAAWRQAIDRTELIRRRVPGFGWGDTAYFTSAPRHRDQVLGPGWALIGDAALQSDPIEGGGVLRALETAEQLAATILAPGEQQAACANDYSRALALSHERHLVLRRKSYFRSDRLGEKFLSLVANAPSEIV